MSRFKEWTNEPFEVVMWVLLGASLLMLMAVTGASIWRNEALPYFPWLVVMTLGLALGFRRRFAGVTVGRDGVSFGSEDHEESFPQYEEE